MGVTAEKPSTGLLAAMGSCRWIVLVSLLVPHLSAYIAAQNCTTNNLESGLGSTAEEPANGLIAEYVATDQFLATVRVVRSRTVCLATDSTRGQYRYASVIAEYVCTGDSCPAGEALSGSGSGAGSGNITGE